MYPYHNKILQRIRCGELIGVTESNRNEYAFVLVFSSAPYTRPVRPHAVQKYLWVDCVKEFLKAHACEIENS